jgi:hypothetical protein
VTKASAVVAFAAAQSDRKEDLVECVLDQAGEVVDGLTDEELCERIDRNSPARQRRLVAQLEAMGHRVTVEPTAA